MLSYLLYLTLVTSWIIGRFLCCHLLYLINYLGKTETLKILKGVVSTDPSFTTVACIRFTAVTFKLMSEKQLGRFCLFLLLKVFNSDYFPYCLRCINPSATFKMKP